MNCKFCNQEVNGSTHNCPKKGLLSVDNGDSFLVSAVIGAATDSAIIGGLLGGKYERHRM